MNTKFSAALAGLLLCVLAVPADGEEAAAKQRSVLEGVLKVHPKYLYKYYLDGFADGQKCALFEGPSLKDLKPGSWIRVEGRLVSRFHEGGSADNPSPFPRTWYIGMEVEKATLLRGPAENSVRPPGGSP